MEPQPGMFVSHTDAAVWEPDPEVPGSDMHELFHEGGLWAGQTRITGSPPPMTWTPEQREIAVVLEGAVRIAFEDGTDVTVGVGDMIAIPAGMTTTWHVRTPFREMWVLAER